MQPEAQFCKALLQTRDSHEPDITVYPVGSSPYTHAIEPPYREPDVRWCERTGLTALAYFNLLSGNADWHFSRATVDKGITGDCVCLQQFREEALRVCMIPGKSSVKTDYREKCMESLFNFREINSFFPVIENCFLFNAIQIFRD